MSDTEAARLQAKLDCEHQIALEAEEMREAAVLECEQQRQRANEAERALAEVNRQISNLSQNYRDMVEHNVRLQQRVRAGEAHVQTLLEGYATYEAVEARAWLSEHAGTPLSEEARASLERGIVDVREGRVRPLEQKLLTSEDEENV